MRKQHSMDPRGRWCRMAIFLAAVAAGGVSTPAWADLVITEIMYDPANAEPAYEYVEIHNTGASTVNLVGYVFDDNSGTVYVSANITAGSIPAGGTAVLIGPGRLSDMQTAWGNTINFVEVTNWPQLNNSPDQIGLWANLASYGSRNFAAALDTVAYTTSGPWPTTVTPNSIYLTAANLNTTANDSGANWAESQDGVDGAYQAAVGTDVGSPGEVPAAAPICPVADNDVQDFVTDGPGLIIDLVATDADTPLANLTFTVVTLPSQGTLTDPNDGEAAVIAGTPVAADQVRYTPGSSPGSFSFTFKANDGDCGDSNVATVTLNVADAGTPTLVITEIMYNPAGTEPDYEYIEIYNAGANPVNLAGYVFDDNAGTPCVVAAGTVEPGGNAVLIGPGTLANMQAAWGTGINFVEVDVPLGLNNDTISPGVTDQIGLWSSLTGYDSRNYANAIDTVTYDDGSPWPVDNGVASIHVGAAHLTLSGNDSGTHWNLSQTGVNAAYTSAGGDVGSPGFVPGGSAAATVLAWRSVRTHTNVGDLSVTLDPDSPVTEPRQGGPSRVEVDFSLAVEATDGLLDVGDVTITDTSMNPYTPSSVSMANGGRRLVIGFNAGVLPAATTCTISLAGEFRNAVSGPAVIEDVACPIRLIPGDINNTGNVNMIDVSGVRAQNRQAVGASTLQYDLNADGKINLIDAALARALHGG